MRESALVSQSDADHENRREFPRLHSGAECTISVGEAGCRAVLVDASRGGCKLRFTNPAAAMAVLDPVPRDVVIDYPPITVPATVMWAHAGLAGCQFHQHLSLEELAHLLPGHFRPASPCRPAVPSGEEDEEEAELKARIEAEIMALAKMTAPAED